MQPLKLHLGCGQRYLKGYVHVDINDFDHIDYRHDVRQLPMFQDNSVDLIYASHVFEYFDRMEVGTVLKEWRRVLKENGILRLAVPDFDSLVKLYSERKNLESILGPLYGRWELKNKTVLYHKTVYNFASLKKILETAGFSSIQTWNWREVFCGELTGFDDFSQAYFPHMDKEKGQLISLNVEGHK